MIALVELVCRVLNKVLDAVEGVEKEKDRDDDD